jgi:osomolarity two-component system, response regulator SKN7
MMGGSYPESDVARASLVQMNEISRRAEVAGMSFAPVSASASAAAASASGGARLGEAVERPNSALKMMANAAGLLTPDVDGKARGGGGDGMPGVTSRQDALARIEELHRSRPTSAQGSGDVTFGVNGTYQLPFDGDSWAPGSVAGSAADASAASHGQTLADAGAGASAGAVGDATHQGLRVFTMGHLMPKSAHDDGNGNWSFDPDSLGAMLPALPGAYNGSAGTGAGAAASRGVPAVSAPPPTQQQQQQSGKSAGPEAGSGTGPGAEVASTTATPVGAPPRPTTAQKLRVRRSTFVPGWAVPPRVLLVDDDEVNRRMSSKFLQVFGCTIDVAVDGIGAVERMNLEKYDLVLMVR